MLSRTENLSLDPGTPTKLGGAACVYVLSTRRASGACWPAESVNSKFKALSHKNTKWREVEGDSSCQCLASTCTYVDVHITHRHEHIRAHTHTPVLSSGFDDAEWLPGPAGASKLPNAQDESQHRGRV